MKFLQSLPSRALAFFRAHRAARIMGYILIAWLAFVLLFHPRGTKTYLILGMDNYGSLNVVGRSDVMMLVQIDFSRADISTVTFARDMFILSFYLRGISPIDLSYLRKTDICQGYIYYSRSKTGQQMQIRIVPDIQRILDKYSDTHTQYLLPLIKREDGTEQKQYRNSTQAINRNLKKLAERLQLSSPLTLYVARHSWASIAQSFNVPINVISGAMGHDSETTTQIYLASIQTSKIDEANSLIIDSI